MAGGQVPVPCRHHITGYQQWKSLANRIRSDQKSLFTVTGASNKIIHFISYALFYVLNTQFCWKQLSIADFAIVAKDGLFWLSIETSPQLICDVTQTWSTGIMTLYSSIVLARANLRKDDLHLWITTVNIDFSPPDNHGLVCKKYAYQWFQDISRDF